MVVKPVGNQSPVAKFARLFPAEDYSVFSQVGIDLFGVELFQNFFPVNFDIVLPGDFVILVILHQRPAGTELPILANIFEPGQIAGVAVGNSHQVQPRFPDFVGEVI